MGDDVVRVERVIPASAGGIFDLLADPDRHPEIDGSHTLRGARPGAPRRLALGDTFGMSMRIGVPYRMSNRVVEFEEDRRIAWEARVSGPSGRILGGRIWRYELEPVAGGTRVRESWDISRDGLRMLLRRGRVPETTRANMERTLARIERMVTGAGPPDDREQKPSAEP